MQQSALGREERCGWRRCAFGALVWSVCWTVASAQPAAPLAVRVVRADGVTLAENRAPVQARQVRLHFAHLYQPGDRIVVDAPANFAVSLDQALPACEVHRAAPGTWSFALPFGSSQQETGSAYAPGAFAAAEHSIRVRLLSRRQLGAVRNLALNPCDQTDEQPLAAFPHATASSVHLQMPVFAARNTLDGVAQNTHHGAWPYQSWGPEKRSDLWWRLDFGRTVELARIRIFLRADFPHDSYWRQATLEFSDGATQRLTFTKTADAQEFHFPPHRTAWIRLTHLEPADGDKWCALTEVEAWGRDLR